MIGENPTAVASRWNEWLDRFANYMGAMDIKDATRKRAMLLHFEGNDFYQIFRTLRIQEKQRSTTRQKLNQQNISSHNKTLNTNAIYFVVINKTLMKRYISITLD